MVSGVYFLFLQHELIYVGRSKDCYQRIDSHRAQGRAFDYALVAAAPEWDTTWLEPALIKALEAQQNRTLKAKAAGQATQVIVQEVRTGPHPLMTYNKGEAAAYAANFGLGAALREATRSGELQLLPKHPENPRRGNPMLITHQALTEWCERKQRERLAAAGRPA